jgi:hypothetical protein
MLNLCVLGHWLCPGSLSLLLTLNVVVGIGYFVGAWSRMDGISKKQSSYQINPCIQVELKYTTNSIVQGNI